MEDGDGRVGPIETKLLHHLRPPQALASSTGLKLLGAAEGLTALGAVTRPAAPAVSAVLPMDWAVAAGAFTSNILQGLCIARSSHLFSSHRSLFSPRLTLAGRSGLGFIACAQAGTDLLPPASRL